MAFSGSSRSKALAAAPWALGALAAPAAGCGALIGITDVPVPFDASLDGSPADASSIDVAVAAQDAPVDAMTDAGPDVNGGDALAPDASPCGDTQGSSSNCGRCGHDCLGARCTMSLCEPTALVPRDAGASPFGIAQDGTFVYWTDYDNGTVTRTDKNTGASTILNQSTYFPASIVADDAGLYWGDSSGVWRCPKTGCALGSVLAAMGHHVAVASVAIDDQNLYWSEGEGVLLTAPKSGVDSPAAVLFAIDGGVEQVATDGQRVYFTATDGLLRGGAIDGGARFAIGTPGAVNSYGVTVAPDGGDAFFSVPDPSNGAIAHVPVATLEVLPVATSLSYPAALATDGTSVYWVRASDPGGNGGAIYGCSIASCVPTLLANVTDPIMLVIDDRYVYYTDYESLGRGGIFKVPR